MEISNDYERSSGGGFFAFVLIVLVVVGALWMFSVQHAVDRHGSVAMNIINQCTNNQWSFEVTNPNSRRVARVCKLLDTGKFGIAIFEDDNSVVSAFLNKAKSELEAVKYLQNTGYDVSEILIRLLSGGIIP